jgi:hypothetical protein
MSKSLIGFGSRVRVSTEECEDLGGAILDIEEGKQTDMVFHTKVKKIFYLLTGKLKATLIADGKIKALEINKGSSFAVMPGLVYQLQGLERSIVIEFCNASPALADKDLFVVTKGTQPADKVPAGSYAQLSKTDLENLKAQGEKVLAERAAAKVTDGAVVVEPVESESAGPEPKKTSKKKSRANRNKN